jgi:hypothetical protein
MHWVSRTDAFCSACIKTYNLQPYYPTLGKDDDPPPAQYWIKKRKEEQKQAKRWRKRRS